MPVTSLKLFSGVKTGYCNSLSLSLFVPILTRALLASPSWYSNLTCLRSVRKTSIRRIGTKMKRSTILIMGKTMSLLFHLSVAVSRAAT